NNAVANLIGGSYRFHIQALAIALRNQAFHQYLINLAGKIALGVIKPLDVKAEVLVDVYLGFLSAGACGNQRKQQGRAQTGNRRSVFHGKPRLILIMKNDLDLSSSLPTLCLGSGTRDWTIGERPEKVLTAASRFTYLSLTN